MESRACLDFGKCSRADDSINLVVGLVGFGVMMMLIVQGWRSRLYGCHFVERVREAWPVHPRLGRPLIHPPHRAEMRGKGLLPTEGRRSSSTLWTTNPTRNGHHGSDRGILAAVQRARRLGYAAVGLIQIKTRRRRAIFISPDVESRSNGQSSRVPTRAGAKLRSASASSITHPVRSLD